MRRLSLVALLVTFFSSGVFASNDWVSYVGNWTDPAGWSESRPPSGAEEVKVRGQEAICTLNTSTGDWGVGQRMRVYEGARLIIEDGAELLGTGWMRVGATDTGYLVQTGGLLRLTQGKDTGKLGVGDQAGSDGSYTISGGSLAYSGDGGDLLIGARGGRGTFTIVSAEPSIAMNNLYVGNQAGASGTLEFQIGAAGVSPINLAGTAYLDPEGTDTVAALILSLLDAPPVEQDILLITGTIQGTFDTVNGAPAAEGASVALNFAGSDYAYTLTYADGVALQWVPEPATLLLFGLGGLIVAARRPRSKK